MLLLQDVTYKHGEFCCHEGNITRQARFYVLMQGTQQLWRGHGARDGAGGECAVHGAGRPLCAADRHLHGHAPCCRHRSAAPCTVRAPAHIMHVAFLGRGALSVMLHACLS